MSFNKMLSCLNDKVEIYFCCVPEVDQDTVLHIANAPTGLSVPRFLESKFPPELMKSVELVWINQYGAPINLSADP